MKLSPEEIRAAYFAVAQFRRNAALAGRPIPQAVIALDQKLDAAVRCTLPPTRQETDSGTAELADMEWIGTRLAARLLGWCPRTVQRRVTDLDGRLVGGRLIFPRASVEAYRAAKERNL